MIFQLTAENDLSASGQQWRRASPSARSPTTSSADNASAAYDCGCGTVDVALQSPVPLPGTVSDISTNASLHAD